MAFNLEELEAEVVSQPTKKTSKRKLDPIALEAETVQPLKKTGLDIESLEGEVEGQGFLETLKTRVSSVFPRFREAEGPAEFITETAKAAALPLTIPAVAGGTAIRRIPGVEPTLKKATAGAAGLVTGAARGDVQEAAEAIEKERPLAEAAGEFAERFVTGGREFTEEELQDPSVFRGVLKRLPRTVGEIFGTLLDPEALPEVVSGAGAIRATGQAPPAVSRLISRRATRQAATKMREAKFPEETVKQFEQVAEKAIEAKPPSVAKSVELLKRVQEVKPEALRPTVQPKPTGPVRPVEQPKLLPPPQPTAPEFTGGTPALRKTRDPKVFTEKQALRRSLKRQAQAAVQASRATTQELQGIKREISDTVRDNLPVSDRGRFIAKIANARTPKDVAKATMKVNERVEELEKKEAIQGIKSSVDRALDSPNVDIQFKQKIEQAMAPFKFTGTTKLTTQNIQEIQNKLANESLVGENNALKQELTEELKVLSRKPMKDLNIAEVKNLQQKISLLENLGRQRVITRGAILQREKAIKTQRLLDDTQPISKRPLREPDVERALTGEQPGVIKNIEDAAVNAYKEFTNQVSRIDLAITPMDTVFDLMDGGKNFTGANYEVIRKGLDTKYNNYLNERDFVVDKIDNIAKNLSESSFQRIAVHAYRAQPNGENYLINSGITKEMIDKVKLTPEELNLYNAMRTELDKLTPRIIANMREIDNKTITPIQNYFPVQIDFNKVSDIEVFQRIGDMMNGDALGRRTKTVRQGFTKERVGTKKAIKLNAVDTFRKHVDDVVYYLNMQKDIKMLSEIVNSPRYQQKAGDLGGLAISQWMDLMARKGGSQNVKKIELLDTLRRNVGTSVLGLKLSSILIQPTAFFDGASLLGIKGSRFLPGSLQDVILDKNTRVFLRENFPELRDRGADDPAYLDLAEGKLVRGVQNAGFSYLKKADILTASAVTLAAYKNALSNRGIEFNIDDPINTQAVEEAQRLLRVTQASSHFKDLPLAISRGALTGNKSLDKAILQFKTFMLSRWNLYRNHMWRLGFRAGNPKQAAEIGLFLTMANAAETGIRMGTKAFWLAVLASGPLAWKEMDELFDESEFAKNFIFEQATTVPFIGDAIRMAAYRGDAVPLLQPVTKFTSGAAQAVQAKTTKSRLNALVNATEGILTIGGITGIGQIAQILRTKLRTSPTLERRAKAQRKRNR